MRRVVARWFNSLQLRVQSPLMGVLLLSDLLCNWSAKDRHGLCPTIQHCKCLVLLMSRNNIALHCVNYLNDQVGTTQIEPQPTSSSDPNFKIVLASMTPQFEHQKTERFRHSQEFIGL
eukprot:m.272648 g.272648  ORF g.272648 m.272648 type:complete len:118 (-) comp16110_c0_seq5:2472-2825(-)